MRHFAFILLLMVFGTNLVWAQEEPEESIFDKKKNYMPVFILKTSPTRLIRGELPLLAEIALSEKWHLEFGPSLLYYDVMSQVAFKFPLYDPEHSSNSYHQSIIRFSEAKFNIGYTLHTKYMMGKIATGSGYGWGLYLNHRNHLYNFEGVNFNLYPGKIRAKEVALTFIYQTEGKYFMEHNIAFGFIHYAMDYAKIRPGFPARLEYDYAVYSSFRPRFSYTYKIGLSFLSGK